MYLQLREPSYSAYVVPNASVLHVVQFDAPDFAEYFPISQRVQLEAPTIEIYFPDAQRAQVDDMVAPTFVEYFPVAHDMQCVAVAVVA